MSLREKALACKPRRKKIDVPEWGGSVMVRGLTGHERDQWDREAGKVLRGDANVNFRAFWVARCCYEDNKRIFADTDIPSLAQTDARPIEKIFDAIRELSGIAGESEENAEKNSEKTSD